MIIRGSLGYFNLSCGIYTVCSTRYRVFVAIVIFYPNSYTVSSSVYFVIPYFRIDFMVRINSAVP